MLPTHNPDPGYEALGPIYDYTTPPSPVRVRRFFTFLTQYWWIPAATLVLTLAAAAIYVRRVAPTFISRARMWESEKLRLPEGASYTENLENYLGTQMELLKSPRMQGLTLARLRALKSNAVPAGPNGQPLPVSIRVTQTPKSSVLVIEGASSQAAYTEAYLNALMDEYLQYRRNLRKATSGDTLASISGQVLRFESDPKTERNSLVDFERTNNFIVLQQEGAVASAYLARLKTELSDLKLESQLLEATAFEQVATRPGDMNLVLNLAESTSGRASAASATALSDRASTAKQLELLKLERAKFSRYLRPEHPKIVKLDDEIERGKQIIEIYRHQSREQLAVTQQATKFRMSNVLGSIQEWEGKVVEANSRIAEAERLKLNVSRTQSLYERLLTLLQNVDLVRNLDQETFGILDAASTARPYRQEVALLGVAILGALAVGLGIILLLSVRDDRFRSVAEVTEKLGDAVVGQVPEVLKARRHSPLPLLEHDDPRHMYAESYRSLRSALLFLVTEGERPRVLLIASALPNEGKSTIAANLALILALGGPRVLLVDGDLRKGTLH
ncbi:MAG: hypothetical protein DME22_16955, partial [Verrucomicrobia bacterium]